MKAFQKIFVIAMLLLSTATVFAAEVVPNVRIEQSGFEKKVSVVIERLKAQVTVQVITAEGVVLENETATGEKYAKIFNLENLEAGNYKIVVLTDRNEVVQPFSIKAKELVLNPATRETYFLPTLSWKNDALDVMMFNNRLMDVNLTLLDERGNTVFEDKMQNVLKVERRYNLNHLYRGKYLVQVSTPHKTYYQEIAVR